MSAYQAGRAQEVRPDITGFWVRIARTCGSRAAQNGSYRLKIDQHDETLRLEVHATVRSVAKELVLSFKLNEPLRYTGLDGDDYVSTALWQRNRLVIRSVEIEKGKRITSEEIWKLSEDGNKLVTEKREDREEEHSTCTSTFEKSDETKTSSG